MSPEPLCLPLKTNDLLIAMWQTAAIRKASIPSLLVSAKCDTPTADRELDPSMVEQKARRSINGVGTLQSSQSSIDEHKKAMSVLLRNIIFGTQGASSSV